MSAIESRFLDFHADNPGIYTKLVELAHKVKAAGFNRYSMKSLFERLRWHSQIETKGDPFKLNNNYTSQYARLIMARNPELNGLFSTRGRV